MLQDVIRDFEDLIDEDRHEEVVDASYAFSMLEVADIAGMQIIERPVVSDAALDALEEMHADDDDGDDDLFADCERDDPNLDDDMRWADALEAEQMLGRYDGDSVEDRDSAWGLHS